MKNSWRDNVEVLLRKHLELQIRESFKHKDAIEKSAYPNLAQLWIAIANLSKQNFEMELRIKFLEKSISDLMEKQLSQEIVKTKKRRK
ncbi:MAG: hypothetical protein PHF86_12125 [Candidatus Nanoarchaeia archaeon]|nr:hypothetical protein [Candidatus Nanoarchaeia archaeon]